MLKRALVGALGTVVLASWWTPAHAWEISNISYRPGGSYICEVVIQYGSAAERDAAIKAGTTSARCGQSVQQSKVKGYCRGADGRIRPSKAFSFNNEIQGKLYENHCQGLTCSVSMKQPIDIDDVAKLLESGDSASLPGKCAATDTAQACMEKIFGVNSADVCNEKNALFFGAEFSAVNLAIATGAGHDTKSRNVSCVRGKIPTQFDCN